MDAEWRVTVSRGKASAALPFRPQSARALAELRLQISQRFGVAPQHQRLLCRGSALAGDGSSALVADGCRILLLSTQPAGDRAASSGKAEGIEASGDQVEDQQEGKSGSKLAFSTVDGVSSSQEEEDEDAVKVLLLRGKSALELVVLRDQRVLDVKARASALLALSSPHALRLIIKGKTPDDSATLDEIAGKAKTVKCMVLLQAQQHSVLEKEGEFRDLLNELVQLQAARRRVEKQMARNFASRDESLFQLSTLADRAEHVSANLELLQQHLAPTGASGKRVGASEHTIATLQSSLDEAQQLAKAARELLDKHSTY